MHVFLGLPSETNMRKSCNLELELRLSSYSDECSTSLPHHQSGHDLQEQQHQQKLTIFYNGVMCVCDVTELQARAILCVANNEIGEVVATTSRSSPSVGSYESSSSRSSVHYSPLCTSSSVAAAGGLSIQKSLRKFLQKKKTSKPSNTSLPLNDIVICKVDGP